MPTRSRFKVAVTDFTESSLEIEAAILEPLGCELVLGHDRAAAALQALVQDADAVITQFAPVTAQVIGAMAKCRVIVRYGIGVDNVDLQAAAARQIPVCNVPDYCTHEVADHTLALILAATRQLLPTAAAVKAGRWKTPVPVTAMYALKDLTVGLVGLGKIGREVARRLRPFQCPLLACDPAVAPGAVRQLGGRAVGLQELFAASDLISLHCPSTAQTRYLINAQSLAQMKRGVILVNASRGTLVRTPDLVAALQSGQVAAAALDVTDPEPINPDSPLLKMDQVIITSHVASGSPAAVKKLREQAAGLAALALRGEKLPNVVNGVDPARRPPPGCNP